MLSNSNIMIHTDIRNQKQKLFLVLFSNINIMISYFHQANEKKCHTHFKIRRTGQTGQSGKTDTIRKNRFNQNKDNSLTT